MIYIDWIPRLKFELENITDIQVSPHERMLQGRDMTVEELHQAVKDMAKNKTPGYDGLTTEFYLTFWDQLGELLFNALKLSFEQNELFPSAKTGILNLILKPGKDSRFLKKS